MHQRGGRVYNRYCYFCHGYQGNARTVAAEFLSPPPRDFTDPQGLEPTKMAETIRNGRTGTAMKPFGDILTDAEIEAVARYAYDTFALCGEAPTAYHTVENGWADHRERYEAAYPFVLGEIPADGGDDVLSADQRQGRELYRRTCVICHEKDRMRRRDDRASHDRHGHEADAATRLAANDTVVSDADGILSGTEAAAAGDKHDEGYGYGLGNGPHDQPPAIPDLTPFEDKGEHLYLDNCAYCHAADGTGLNWIGTFLQPHPPDLTDRRVTAGYTDESIRRAILDGLPDTSMPAFRTVVSDEEVAAIIAYMNRAFLGR